MEKGKINEQSKVKSPSSAGINISRLVNKEAYKNFDQLIKCKICFNILVDPNDCEKCKNTFCHTCISKLIDNNLKCPYNCENFTIKPTSLAINSFLSSLKFTCLNKELGCNNIIPYSQVPSHDKECSFAFSNCPNLKCSKPIRRQNLEQHIRKECEFSLFKCENCEMELNRNDYLEHVGNCKLVENVLEVRQPIIDKGQYTDYFDIPLKEMSNNNFMRMLLHQLGKFNKEIDKKFDTLNNEINIIKEDFSKSNKNNSLFIENMNNEMEGITEKLNRIEIVLSANEGVKKMMEENMRETLFIRDSVLHNKTFTEKPKISIKEEIPSLTTSLNSLSNLNVNNTNTNPNKVAKPNTCKDDSISSNVSNTQPNSTTNNNSKKQIKQQMSTLNFINKTAEKERESAAKKFATRSNNKKTPTTSKSPVGKSKSPIQYKDRENNIYNSNHVPINPHNCRHSPKTYNVETESFNIRVGNLTLLKTMIKNQEIIIDHLSRIFNKIEISEKGLMIELAQAKEELKRLVGVDVIDEFKAYTLETSLDTSNRIVQHFQTYVIKN